MGYLRVSEMIYLENRGWFKNFSFHANLNKRPGEPALNWLNKKEWRNEFN